AAIWQHDYGAALEFAERTFGLWRRLGDRLVMAQVVANLAELRIKLGMFDHAEHVLAIGVRQLTPGMPGIHALRFGLVAAHLAMERGRFAEAQREIAAVLMKPAKDDAARVIGEAHRVAARLALADGDLE